MPVIPTTRDDVKALRGLHLWHFATSNCSQRVRFALEEKGLPWTSHHVDLARNEHATPGFRALNPSGLVPVLVHDGTTIIESNDVVTWLDESFPRPPLLPSSGDDRAYALRSLETTDAIQPALKLVSHEFLFKPMRRMSPRRLEEFAANCADQALVRFMRDFSSKEGFGRARIEAAVGELGRAFEALEARLDDRPWLTGDDFGLADVSWIVNVHRLALARYPLARFPRLDDWYRRTRARPSFAAAIDAWEGRGARAFFAAYTRWRGLRGTGIGDFATLPAG